MNIGRVLSAAFGNAVVIFILFLLLFPVLAPLAIKALYAVGGAMQSFGGATS